MLKIPDLSLSKLYVFLVAQKNDTNTMKKLTNLTCLLSTPWESKRLKNTWIRYSTTHAPLPAILLKEQRHLWLGRKNQSLKKTENATKTETT